MKLLRNILYEYDWYRQKNILKNGVETVRDSDGIWRLNEKYIREGLDHKGFGWPH